ncbi:MAG: protein kinase [Mogibacterium sp.]|nr:protein kinase [Mogibacterium sp.]
MTGSNARPITEYEPLFGSWYVTRRLGTGAAGSVFEIERKDEFGIYQHAAVKVITLPAGGEDEIKVVRFGGMPDVEIKAYYEAAVQRVVSELELMTKLKGNSHIVSYEDHEIIPHENGIGWDILVRMELLTPMLDYFDGRSMTEDEVIRMGIDLCEGLELCGQYGIVHRDIKPANIFVADNGDFKLGDFGIARIVEETQTSLSRRGTYTYMAPEVYRGGKYDQTADIYSLGMVLYQCLNDGRNAFVPAYPERYDLEDQENAFAKRIAGKAAPPPVHGSETLAAIVQKAFSFRKEDRYRNASEMKADLEALRRGDLDKITALKDDKRAEIKQDDSLTEETKKHRIMPIIVVIALIVLIGAGIFAALFPWEIESIALTADGVEVGSDTEIYIGDRLTPDYTISPKHYEGEPIIFTSSDETVFTVDERGVLTAKGLGEAIMTMKAEDYSDDDYTEEITVRVVPKVTSIKLFSVDPDGQTLQSVGGSIDLTTGDNVELAVQLEPEKFSREAISYKVGDKTVAIAADSSGDTETAASIHLTALKAGETTLKISSGGCTIKKKIIIKNPVVVTYSNPGNSGNSKKNKTRSKTKSGGSKEEGSFGDYEYFD